MVDLAKITSLAGWPEIRKSIENLFSDILQIPAYQTAELNVRFLEENDVRGGSRRQIVFPISDVELVTGWLFTPDGKKDCPCILCCHHESTNGKDEAAGLEGSAQLAFAQHYAELGYMTLAIDVLTVGKRSINKREAFDTEGFYKTHKKMSFAGKMVLDHRRALDVFSEIKRADPSRIGVVGHGLGGLNALLLAACDDRVQACVASCGFTRFSTDKVVGTWPGMEQLLLYPKIKKFVEAEDVPFDWEHILALAAPTPVQIITSVSKSLHNNPKSCQKAISTAAKIYKLLGAPGAIDHYTHHDGHAVSSATTEVADEWFERWL